MANAQARYFEILDEGVVRCILCPHHCRLKEGQIGICRVRSNQNGNLLTHNYGEVTSWPWTQSKRNLYSTFTPAPTSCLPAVTDATWGVHSARIIPLPTASLPVPTRKQRKWWK